MAQLVSVLRSPEWLVYATEDNKLYYVNVATQSKRCASCARVHTHTRTHTHTHTHTHHNLALARARGAVWCLQEYYICIGVHAHADIGKRLHYRSTVTIRKSSSRHFFWHILVHLANEGPPLNLASFHLGH